MIKQALIPMPSFFLGILRQMEHTRIGHGAFLNGQNSSRGWWYYYFEVIAIKSPIALLLGLAVALGLLIWRRRVGWRTLLVAIPLAVYTFAAVHGHIDIGVRLVLPIISLLYLLVCLQLGLRRAWMTATLSALLVLGVVETAAVQPDYTGFFNVLVGGSANGGRYLADSNVDWGQDLGRLTEWMQSPGVAGRPYTLDLFCNPEHELVQAMGLDDKMLGVQPSIERGGLAIMSVNYLDEKPEYDWVEKYPMIKRIGTSIDVFDLGGGSTAHVANLR